MDRLSMRTLTQHERNRLIETDPVYIANGRALTARINVLDAALAGRIVDWLRKAALRRAKAKIESQPRYNSIAVAFGTSRTARRNAP